jgi:hypothetical protein
LTGCLVFEAGTLFQMMAKRLRDDPVPPSQRTSFPIDPALDAVILACLARNPEDRPASAAELRKRLGAIDVPRWDEDQAKEWWNHQPGESASLRSLSDDATTLAQVRESEAV